MSWTTFSLNVSALDWIAGQRRNKIFPDDVMFFSLVFVTLAYGQVLRYGWGSFRFIFFLELNM